MILRSGTEALAGGGETLRRRWMQERCAHHSVELCLGGPVQHSVIDNECITAKKFKLEKI